MKKGYLEELDLILNLNNRNIKDSKKYVEFTSSYFPEIIHDNSLCSDYYLKFVDRLISKDPILYKVYEEKKLKKEVAVENNLTETMIYNYFNRHKNQTRERYNNLYCKYDMFDFDDIVTYLEFSELFFHGLLENPDNFTRIYKEYTESKINKSDFLSKIYKDGVSLNNLASELGVGQNTINNKLNKLKKELKEEYELLEGYKNNSLKDALMYLSFTKYFFPTFIGKEIIYTEDYMKMVNKALENDELLTKRFKERIPGNKIYSNKTPKQVYLMLEKKKDKVDKLFNEIVLKKKQSRF